MEKVISVYIVEDDKLARTTYKLLFSQIEDEINIEDTFETAEECLEMLKKKPVDVVLMDIGLPYMNGIEATKILKRRFANTKVLMLTSHERGEEILASMASGANAYAIKDIDFPTLVTAIKHVQQGGLWIDPRIAGLLLKFLPKPESTDLENFTRKKTKKNVDYNFSDQDIEILKLIQKGKTNREIGEILHISEHTAKSHISKIFRKLSVNARVEAALKAVEYNLF